MYTLFDFVHDFRLCDLIRNLFGELWVICQLYYKFFRHNFQDFSHNVFVLFNQVRCDMAISEAPLIDALVFDIIL